jgi:hypothetical protein
VAKNIAHEALRQFRVANVEGCLFSKATDVPAAQWVECRDDLDAALMLVGYLEDPERERLGNWRHTLVDFIVKFTERWGYDHPRGNPDESLKQALERLGNPAEAKAWAARRVVELEAKLDSEPAWDTGAAAEMVLADMAKLGTVNTQSNRNLQRLLTEYRKLQERSLD